MLQFEPVFVERPMEDSLNDFSLLGRKAQYKIGKLPRQGGDAIELIRLAKLAIMLTKIFMQIGFLKAMGEDYDREISKAFNPADTDAAAKFTYLDGNQARFRCLPRQPNFRFHYMET